MSGLGVGNYPPEFNAKIHGPYDPSRFYGKADVKFTDVKIGEMGQWLARRNYHPLAMVRACSRGYWKWANTWLFAKKAGPAPVIHFMMAASGLFYISTYSFIKYHRHCKYH